MMVDGPQVSQPEIRDLTGKRDGVERLWIYVCGRRFEANDTHLDCFFLALVYGIPNMVWRSRYRR